MPNNTGSSSGQRVSVINKLSTDKEEKKEIDGVHVFDYDGFQYNKVLGEGAFGIVRKAQL